MKKAILLCFTAVLMFTACSRPGGRAGSETRNETESERREIKKQHTDETAGEAVSDNTGGLRAEAPGQTGTEPSRSDTSADTGFYAAYTTLTDTTTGVPVMDVILPEGWTAQVQTDWSFVSTNNPCIANIFFTSPDHTATVLIQTAQDYLQNYDTSGMFPHQDYTDMENYIVHLAYKNAGQVLDLCFNGVIGSGGTVESETPTPAEVQSLLDQTADTYLNSLVDGINQIGGGYGISAQASGSEGTFSMRRYRYTGNDGQSYLADAMALCVAAEYIAPSYGTNFVYTQWVVPAVMIYTAPDEATLEKYRSQYETILDTGVIRNEFNYVKKLYGNDIRNKIMQQQTASISAMTEAQAQSYMSSYDSSGDSYTSDDWANDWSDYIYDRSEYTTTDGGTIKAGTEFDSVYQNGDEFYFGSEGSAPYGWDQLTPN